VEHRPEIRPEHAQEQEKERVGTLLRRCRARLGADRASLGKYLRLPNRVGKVVTQEEVAEAVGISRQWYALLENERPVRISAAVLAAIADVLMMDKRERGAFFWLAVPELRAATLMESSAELLDAFGSLRRVSRPLWAATTEAEALSIVREHAVTQIGADRIVTPTRLGEGRWMYSASGGDTTRGERFTAELRERCGPHVFDDLLGYTIIAQPGELLTSYQRDARFPDLAIKVRRALDVAGMPDVSVAMASVRSQHGFVARLMAVTDEAYTYSELELAQLGALADLTSLALSGRAASTAT
jgi:transcriptional regulator with XRE-family HTH domain